MLIKNSSLSAMHQSPRSAQGVSKEPETTGPLVSKDDVIFGSSVAAGTLAVGAGVGYLGFQLGMEYGMTAGVNAFGGHPVGQAAGALLVGIPLAIAYGLMGAAAGTAVGGVVGGAAGFGVAHLITRDKT